MGRYQRAGFVWTLEMGQLGFMCEACSATMTPPAGTETGASDWAARHVDVCPRRNRTPSADAPDVPLPFPSETPVDTKSDPR